MTEHATFDLAYWINERYAIKERRAAGTKPPWTSDPIMASVRWCNVHREDDAVTKWMRMYWSASESPVWWFVLGRMLNYIPTLTDITTYGADDPDGGRAEEDLPHIDGLRDGLKAMRDSGAKVFTSAYTISTCGVRMDKIDYVMEVVRKVKEYEGYLGNIQWSTLEVAWDALRSQKGLGSFLSAQVVADLKNTPGHPLQKAPDWWAWAAPGPGSLRGLNWYFNGHPEGQGGVRVTPTNFKHHLEICYQETWPLVNIDVPRVCMQDFQNVMCEFSKYMKVKHLNGHVRNRYIPHAY